MYTLDDTEHHLKEQNIIHPPETTFMIFPNFLPKVILTSNNMD